MYNFQQRVMLLLYTAYMLLKPWQAVINIVKRPKLLITHRVGKTRYASCHCHSISAYTIYMIRQTQGKRPYLMTIMWTHLNSSKPTTYTSATNSCLLYESDTLKSSTSLAARQFDSVSFSWWKFSVIVGNLREVVNTCCLFYLWTDLHALN